jgi:hypothetical protein
MLKMEQGYTPVENQKRINVLSIDGGGIRGIVPALILEEIERRTSKPISKLFDVIAGTSTGGILSLALTKPMPSQPTLPQYSASDLVALYEHQGHRFFPKSRLRGLRNWVYGSKFPARGLSALLHEQFGETKLSDALTDVTIAAYDIENRRGFFFKSHKARQDELKGAYDFLMRDCARATSAAPTYFRPAEVQPLEDDEVWHLVDGGVCANNPGLVGYTEAMRIHRPEAKRFGERNNICLVSIGTGELTDSLPIKQTKRWGKWQWLEPALEVMSDGPTHATHYQLNELLPEWSYYRVQPYLDGASDSMEDVTQQNISKLKDVVKDWLFQENDPARTHLKNSLDRQSKRTNRLNICCDQIVSNRYYLSIEDLAKSCQTSVQDVGRILEEMPDYRLLCAKSSRLKATGYSDETLERVKQALITSA